MLFSLRVPPFASNVKVTLFSGSLSVSVSALLTDFVCASGAFFPPFAS